MGRKPSATSCSTPTEHTLTELNERLPPLTNTKTCLREHEQNNRPTLQICCPFHCFFEQALRWSLSLCGLEDFGFWPKFAALFAL